MNRLIAIGALVATTTGCTAREVTTWLEWHDTDPTAAEAFANTPEIQAELHAPAPVAAPSPHSAKWDAIAMCESGGNWSHPPVTNRTGTYSGGLMIWQKAWVAYGGQQFASLAYLASRVQQITVAERILADRGWGAWDCA
jgi:hypothetical protein